ncbi:zinc-binding dehydrogenase, partial [Streptomyces atratus]|uniref:zinc-binding dehydrogenase n=1 Tax=Streptomyces atratus TaxID=1893 RepID=UPI0036C5209E
RWADGRARGASDATTEARHVPQPSRCREDFTGVDVLPATVAGQLQDLEPTLVPDGWVVALNDADVEAVEQLSNQGLYAVFMVIEPDRADLEALASLARSGALTVHTDQVFSLEQAAEAHRFGEQGRSTGKIILTP